MEVQKNPNLAEYIEFEDARGRSSFVECDGDNIWIGNGDSSILFGNSLLSELLLHLYAWTQTGSLHIANKDQARFRLYTGMLAALSRTTEGKDEPHA